MLTFLELYQTLLGFVFFKLYTDAGLVYPPPLDSQKDEGAAGIDAFMIKESSKAAPLPSPSENLGIEGKKISTKDVRKTIKEIATDSVYQPDADMDTIVDEPEEQVEEDFVPRQSTSDPQSTVALPTLQSLNSLPQTLSTSLFSPYTFFLSRETSRPIFEFAVRSFGGKIGWPASSGTGSPFDETDDSITHVIIDRPSVQRKNETDEEKERRLQRKYVQPQWVIDCINAGKILLEEPYAQGRILPPHLSPFGEYEGAYDPVAIGSDTGMKAAGEESGDEEPDDSEMEADGGDEEEKNALKAVVKDAEDDPSVLRKAELAAEAAGVDYEKFQKEITKSQKKKHSNTDMDADADREKDMNKMMMSNKQKKLYERVKHSQNKRSTEVNPFVKSLKLVN